MKPFRLSATLLGHTSDVRSVHAVGDSLILSSSRDSSARAWTKSDGQWNPSTIFGQAHEGFVSAVNYTSTPEQDYVLTAGSDGIINVWPYPPPASPPEPSRTLIGHMGNVCCLDVAKNGRIVSGSWDKTAKIWRNFEDEHTIIGHDQAVWAVLALDSNDIQSQPEEITVTGAADNLVRLFRGKKPQSPSKVYKGHTQPVRALVHLPDLPGQGFASASNDCTVRIWNFEGDQLSVLNGHDSFIYSLARFPDGELASSGEDRSMRVWNAHSGELEQTITLPAISLWTLSTQQNGDVIVGSNDATIRIFTRSEDRLTDPASLKEYEESVSSTAINKTQIGDVKTSDLPDTTALNRQGTKEGQVIMVKNGANVEAHQWDSGSMSWKKIGDVVDSVGSGSKKMYEGKEYDYVFDVDVKDDAPPLKLPFNANQSPYEAATQFLQKHELPMSYLDQVVEFIDKNTSGVSLGQRSADPYSSTQAPSTQQPLPSSSVQDPSTTLPHTVPLTFTQVNTPALLTKLKEFNDTLGNENNPGSLEANEIDALGEMVNSLGKSPKASSVSGKGRSALLKSLGWPTQYLLPVLDLTRAASLYETDDEMLNSILSIYRVSLQNSDGSKENQTNLMLILRTFANMINSITGRKVLTKRSEEVLENLTKLNQPQTTLNKNGKIALATCILNFSVLAVRQDLDRRCAGLFVDAILNLFVIDENEAIYRTLVAVGNVLRAPNVTAGTSTPTIQDIRTKAAECSQKWNEDRMKKVVTEYMVL